MKSNNDLTIKELVIRIDERVIGLQKSVEKLDEKLETKADKEDVIKLQNQVSNIKLVSTVLGAVGGAFVFGASLLTGKKF
jgi:hypothetical protein